MAIAGRRGLRVGVVWRWSQFASEAKVNRLLIIIIVINFIVCIVLQREESSVVRANTDAVTASALTSTGSATATPTARTSPTNTTAVSLLESKT